MDKIASRSSSAVRQVTAALALYFGISWVVFLLIFLSVSHLIPAAYIVHAVVAIGTAVIAWRHRALDFRDKALIPNWLRFVAPTAHLVLILYALILGNPPILFLSIATLFAVLFALRPFSSIARTAMYWVLSIYGIISVFPFIFMASTSLMNNGEATGRTGLVPFRDYDITAGADISPCIVRARDTYVESGKEVTETRWTINITDEVAEAQQYGNIAGDNIIERELLTEIPFLSNYCQAWRRGNLGQFMLNSVKITLIQVSGTLVLATLSAYAFAKMEFVGKKLLFAILLSTLMIPGVVTNLPNFLLVNDIGEIFGNQGWIFDTFGFSMCGDKRNCWMQNWPALTIPFMAPVISIFLLRQHFASIPDELWDAAQLDGAGHVRFLLQIVLPLSRAALLVVLLFAFIASWNDLGWPLLVTVGNDEWKPIAVGLQRFFDGESNYPALRMAGSMIAIFPILVLYALTQRTFIEGLSSSGLKG